MALNLSHRPIFPAHLSEDNLVAPIRISNGFLLEGIPERRTDGFVSPWLSEMEVDNCFDYEGINVSGENDSEESSVPKDIIDLLPADPFGMDISSTFTALTGWLEDLEGDYGGYRRRAEVSLSRGDYPIFAELNFIWNKAMEFKAFPGSSGVGNREMVDRKVGRPSAEHELGWLTSLCHRHAGPVCNMGETSSSSKNTSLGQDRDSWTVTAMCVDVDDGSHHPALAFALGYLGVRDLLSVERVCKSLYDTVQNDLLLWKTIHIEQPLNDRLTDDILLGLTKRAQGNLQCLSLVDCPRITEDCLRCILESNPRLTKLSVPGCTRLSIDGIIGCLKAFNAVSVHGIKYLRIGGRYGVRQDQFEELKSLLGTNDEKPTSNCKPLFFHRGNFYLSSEDDRAIDIEMCPRCQNYRLVYDCPAESCQGKRHDKVCRGCRLCISRCIQCGRCISDGEYEETFCLECLCSDCWTQMSKSHERQDRKVSPLHYCSQGA